MLAIDTSIHARVGLPWLVLSDDDEARGATEERLAEAGVPTVPRSRYGGAGECGWVLRGGPGKQPSAGEPSAGNEAEEKEEEQGRHRATLLAIFAPKFTHLVPPELVPLIVEFSFHLGFY